jgi:pSer/pThr/pTyr-binding forkhead associated (FHA) protein
MPENKRSNEKTRIRKPVSNIARIPKRYSAAVVIVSGYAEGMEYPLTLEYTVIGRDKTAGIVLKDPLISRRHAAVIFQDGSFLLRDLESTNGTILNGTMIETVPIKHKDKFRIGDTVMQFIFEDTKKSNTYEIA